MANAGEAQKSVAAMEGAAAPQQSAHAAGRTLALVHSVAPGLGSKLAQLAPRQRGWLLGAVAVSLTAIAILFALTLRPNWKTLYAGLDVEDARSIAAQLTTAQIPYDVSTDGGMIRVPAEQLDKARLATVAKGGPKSGRMGFELFDKPNWVGSEFDEKVNYQRALEGELEHTIASLSDVQSARVHIVLPHESLFSEQQRDAKASVVLKLRRRSLGEGQADAVRNLVASAVDGLSADKVSLIDADGHLPLGTKTAEAEQAEHEQALTAKLIETLEPVTGAGNVRASVTVEYDRTATDETDESYDPSQTVTLSMQRSEQSSVPLPQPAGVPGTASNAPNSGQQAPVYPTRAANQQNMKQESGTYGTSKKTRHLLAGAGGIRRITAAVLVNDKQGPGKNSNWTPRTPQEMENLVALAQAAVGFDGARGDAVKVENIAFDDNFRPQTSSLTDRIVQMTSVGEPVLRYGALLAGVLLVVFLLGRPMLKRVDHPGVVISQGELPEPVEGSIHALPRDEAAIAIASERLQAQQMFDHITETMKRDPVQTSRLLQSWIHTE